MNAVQLLLDAGADVTIGEENGYTPMHGEYIN
jgi:ankyrin repeat protein